MSLTKGSTLAWSDSQTETPMNRTLSLYSFWSEVRCGMLSLQGPHQVAQYSTTYVLPFSKPVTGSPLTHLETASSGALSPTKSVAAGSAGAFFLGLASFLAGSGWK